jgi:hypothetical protein
VTWSALGSALTMRTVLWVALTILGELALFWVLFLLQLIMDKTD